MSFVSNNLRLPTMTKFELVKCTKIYMSNGEQFVIKIGDLVGIQFVKGEKEILLRKGRIKDIITINKRCLSTGTDNESRIILDCSEQFSINVIEIKIKDIIKIADINYHFNDYTDRITNLENNYIDGNKIPVRQGGMVTKEEAKKRVTKLDMDNVIKSDNEDDGRFDDLYEMNLNKPDIEDLRATEEEEDAAEAATGKTETAATKALVYRGIPLMM